MSKWPASTFVDAPSLNVKKGPSIRLNILELLSPLSRTGIFKYAYGWEGLRLHGAYAPGGYISVGLEDVFKIPNITRVLVKREYSNEDILKILGKNHLRVFKEVLEN